MSDRILVLNSGSSRIKFALFAAAAAPRILLSTKASRVAVAVIPTAEESDIARHTCATLGIGTR